MILCKSTFILPSWLEAIRLMWCSSSQTGKYTKRPSGNRRTGRRRIGTAIIRALTNAPKSPKQANDIKPLRLQLICGDQVTAEPDQGVNWGVAFSYDSWFKSILRLIVDWFLARIAIAIKMAEGQQAQQPVQQTQKVSDVIRTYRPTKVSPVHDL